MELNSYIVELSAAQVSAGPYNLDYRYPGVVERTFQGIPTGSDTIAVLVSYTPKGVNQRNIKLKPPPEHETDFQARISAHQDVWTTIAVFTSASTSAVVLQGPIAAFKVEKTGTSAAGTVYALA